MRVSLTMTRDDYLHLKVQRSSFVDHSWSHTTTFPFTDTSGDAISPCAQSGYKTGTILAADYATSIYLDTNTACSITIGQMVTPRRDRCWFWIDRLCCR